VNAPTLHELLARNVAGRADHPALLAGNRVVPYRELGERAAWLAAWLDATGIGPGDRVAIQLPMGVEAVVALFAAARVGAVCVPTHNAFRPSQLRFVLRDLDAALLVTTSRRSRDLGADEPLPPILVVDDGPAAEGVHRWTQIGPGAPPPPPFVSPDELGAIFYTSGSTGMPKGVMHTNRSLEACATILSRTVANHADDRLLGLLPLSASYGLLQLVSAFEVGATYVLQASPFPSDVAETLAMHRVTGFGNTTHSWIDLVRFLVDRPVDLPELRYVTIAGASLPADVLDAFPRVLPHTEIWQCYGQTEGFRVSTVPPDQYEEKRGALGMPIEGVQAFVVDPERGVVAPGESGELLVRSALQTAGYWKNPEVTSAVLKPCPHLADVLGDEVVLHTGDIVRMDEDGCLWFVGRRDAMLKVAGFRASPDEIEDAITSSGLATYAVVFPVEDPSRGKVLHATVFPRSDEPVDEDGILRHCRSKLPAPLVPARLHVWPGEMPTIGPGKADRKRIVEETRARL
jgi:acyl-CoA synthetase (AMP-forming)/AMP-acid ligase II